MTNLLKFKKKYYFLLILILVMLLFVYRYFCKDIRMITLSTEQQQQVNQLLDNSATRCVGVYLIDLPVDFKTD